MNEAHGVTEEMINIVFVGGKKKCAELLQFEYWIATICTINTIKGILKGFLKAGRWRNFI